jgi:hypothetical protein
MAAAGVGSDGEGRHGSLPSSVALRGDRPPPAVTPRPVTQGGRRAPVDFSGGKDINFMYLRPPASVPPPTNNQQRSTMLSHHKS